MTKTAIALLNYNGEKVLPTFLPSVMKYSAADGVAIYLIDNGSTDNSVAWAKQNFSTINIIQLDKNYGFAEGYNKGLAQIDADYYVLLNTDVEVTPNWISPIIDYLGMHPNIAACQPKILAYVQKDRFEHAGAAGGFLDKYGYPFCRGRVMNIVETDTKQYDTETPIFWASGAALFIRRESFWNVGGLDGSFFAHMEEIDLCWRLNARGMSVMYIPSSIVYHLGGGTLNTESPRKLFLNFRNNLFLLYKNLSDKELNQVLRIRFILDNIAALKYLFTGKVEHAKAIWHARSEFKKHKKSYYSKRIENLQKTKCTISHLVSKRSIVFGFFILGRKHFSDYF